jgi:hypothetical protein
VAAAAGAVVLLLLLLLVEAVLVVISSTQTSGRWRRLEAGCRRRQRHRACEGYGERFAAREAARRQCSGVASAVAVEL